MVLVVDDYADSADYLARMLKLSGIEAKAVNDGKTALEVIDRDKPSLVVLDLMMPGMNGMEVLKKLRSQPQTADLPVVVFSAYGDVITDELAELGNLNVSAVFPKRPHHIIRLLDLVVEAAGKELH